MSHTLLENNIKCVFGAGELYFELSRVDVEVLHQHLSQNDAYITGLHLSRVRIVRSKNGKHIKHTVDQNLEEKLSKTFLFLQDVQGKITQVFFPHDDQPELVGLKKGIVSALNLKIHPDFQNTTYSTKEEDDSGIHLAYYNVNERNLTHLHLTKNWCSDDYLKHVDGRPVKGEQHSKSHYYTSLKIQDGAIKNAKRTHFSYLKSDAPYNRPLNKPEFQQQPDLELKASGESHLNLVRCIRRTNRRSKRSSEQLHSSLENLKQGTLSYDGIHRMQWSSIGDPNKSSRTFYELLRCYSDSSVKESELSQCIKELHYLAKTDDEIFENIVNLTLERSHLNLSTWTGLVGAIVVRGDCKTQKILSRALLSEEPRQLSDEEHAKLLEAVFFIPAGPLHPQLLQALLSLHNNSSKSDAITVRAMLVTSGLVRKCHEAGYNRSLSESIAQHLHQSFKTHPARFHDKESQSHDEYIWSHVCAFGNLGHISSLDLITRYLDHDSSGIRYFAVSALRRLPTQDTDHHLLRVLRTDEHVTVKAGVMEVFIERRQKLTDELRDAIEDALWMSEEGDELDSKITEFLENHDDKSHHVKKLRNRRSMIRRKKRALIPALKPREFSLGVQKEWQKSFGASQAGAEAILRFANYVKLKIGIFGGSFEVNLDNLALFRAHVIKSSFNIVDGKAAFRMGAGFKNDIPKDVIHTIADTADSILSTVDGISSIFTQHIQRFINKLKRYLPFTPEGFVKFISETVKFLTRTIQVTRFGKFFNGIVINLRSAWRGSEVWLRIGNLVKKLALNLSNIKLSTGSFGGAFNFLNKLVDIFSRLRFRLPRNFPVTFNIKKFLSHINGPYHSTSAAVEDYFKILGFSVPKNFFEMFHFRVALNFIPTLDKFKTFALRLVNFGNRFVEMLSVFRGIFDIDLPRLYLPEFDRDVSSNNVKSFNFGLRFDWRIKFKFKIDFSGPDFAKLRNFFRILSDVFLSLSNPNINFEQFFVDILPKFRIKFGSKELFGDEDDSNIAQWFQHVIKFFHNLLNKFDLKLFHHGNTANFLDKLSKIIWHFSKGTLGNVCKLQDFMLKSSGKLENFGENLEKDMILGIRNVRNEAQKAIGEVINITLFMDEFINELKQNVSNTAKTFVGQYLTALESSLENVKELADITATFSLKSADKLNGLCHKAANMSGDILDKIQSEAQNAVREIADFVTSNSEGLTRVIDYFKNVTKKLEDWHRVNLAKRLGKVAIVSQTINEFLSLIKTENKVFSDIHNVFKKINNVIQYLNNLPAEAQKANDFADNIRDFATNAKRWEIEFGKLNIRQQFNLDFDEKLRKLCDKFHSFAEDNIKKIQGDNLFKTFREFVTKQTDSLISQSVQKLDILKVPLGKARRDLEEMSNSVEEIEAVLLELRPFSDNFSPVLHEIRQLPNCSDIYFIFDKIITNCGKKAISFGKQAYKEYNATKSEVKAFLELLPNEWESLSLQQCISGGTCLSNSLKKQAESVSNKMQKLKKKFIDFNFEDKLETCKDSVEELSHILEKIKNISKLVKDFSFKEEILKIKNLSGRITGKFFGDDDGHESQVKKRSASQPVTIARNIAEYTRKADKTQEMIKTLVEEVFGGLEKVSRENIEPFQTKLKNVQQQLNVSFLLGKNSAVIGPILQPLQSVVKIMTDFTQTCNNIVDPLKGTILDILFKTSDFTEIFEGKLRHYGETVTKVSEEVNNVIDKVTSFLNTVQLRQKGLDIRDYKKWDQYQHCSADVCLRLIRRSSNLYLSTIFLWKYPHLDDLSSTSLSKAGKWLVPGLFDDYMIRGISQLSNNEMLLGMRGVAANEEKASLLVVVDITSSNTEILKIVQLDKKEGGSFQGDMGGVVVVKSLIWISSGNGLYAVRVSDIRNSMSSKRSSIVSISFTKHLPYKITSISYDDRDNKIWVLESNKAHSYNVDTFGGILEEKNYLVTEGHTRGFTIVRQFGIKYACVAKCSLVAGYQCRLEFHKIAGALDGSSILRVVRTPTGLEAIQTVGTEYVVAAFSSGTFSEKDKIQRIGGDFEDRFFKLNVPVLKTEFAVTENCLYFKVGSTWLIPRQPLFEFTDMKCGTRRKRRALERALYKDVYTDELEKHRRTRRQAPEEVACLWNIEGKPLTGSLPIVPEIGQTVLVFGIPVYFFFGADLYYYANFRTSLCLRDRDVRLALIPGVWLTVYAGASLPLIIVEAGITVEAKLLQTYLIPELSVRVDKWPLDACVQLKMQMTPLSIRVYLWYRFRLCVKISYKKWFKIRISLNWCAKKTFAEWTWSSRSIHKTLFDNCERDVDNTRPGVGVCNAKQVGSKKYFIQWHGFTEDTKIEKYIVIIGSILGSGDDHYSIHGERQSLTVPNLEIMHGRSVYVGVYAINGRGLESDVAHCPVFTAKRRSPVITFINDGDSSTDIDYQKDPTSLAMKYGFEGTFADLSSIRWGISSSDKCTFSESETDVLPLQSIGESYTVKKTGLNLVSGSKYYTRIILVNHLALATVACSDGVTIDITPPIPRNFAVGKGGAKYIPSIRRVSGKFEHFIDKESPVVRYEWKLIDENTGRDATPFTTIPLTQMSPLLHGLSLTSGGSYTAVLKGTNAAGLHAVVNVSGIIPDNTIPVCEGLPRDVIGFNEIIDRDFVSRLTNLTAMFACYDDDSGIQSIQACVGTYPGGEDVHPFIDIRYLTMKESEDLKTKWVAFVNVSITERKRYHVTVKVEDRAGYRRTISSDGILMDTTGPTVLPTYIRDGFQGIDRKYSKEFDVFPAHWENAFADTESGIGEYFVGLGSSAGLDDKSSFKSNNLSTKAVLRGDSLESGMKYYVTVIACNRVGMCVNGSSNGAIVDFIPPHTGLVIAGQKGPPLEITWINKAVWARWQWCSADKSELSADTCDAESFYDEHSGIRRFGLAVFSYDMAKILTPVKIVGRVVSGGLHVVMPNGVFSVVVEAEDRAGGSSNAISKSFIVDTTPPKIVKLHHGKENEQVMYTRAKDYLFTAFFEISEDISDIVSYSVGVSTFPEGDDLVSFTKYDINVVANIIRVNWTLADAKTLLNGRMYYITVKSTNAAGLFFIASSPPLVFDNEPPLVSFVFDGWGVHDSQYHQFSNIYRMHWQGVADVSRIGEIQVCLSSILDEKECNFHPKVTISTNAVSYTFTNISLLSGVYCYAYLRIKDKAGNYGNFWSNGALVDTSRPEKGRVTDGHGRNDIDYQRETNMLYASWSGFSENETIIHHYELAFGTSPNDTNVQPFTNVGLVTSASSSNFLVSELRNGVVYYAQVVAYNSLGIRSDIGISDGVLIEITPPVFLSPVSDGTLFGSDFDYSSNSTSLSLNWKCEDNESGLRQVFVGVGTQPGIQDIAMYRAVLPYQNAYNFDGLNLTEGVRYFSSVKCTNNVGLQSSMSSDGIIIDFTPPKLKYVYIGSRRQNSPQIGLGSVVTANWKFKDFESNVARYMVSIYHVQNNTRTVGPWVFSGNQTFEHFYLRQNELAHKERYVLSVVAFNGAGLRATALSNAFLVDGTAPICTDIYDTTQDGSRTDFSGLTSKLAFHANCNDTETEIYKYQFAIINLNTSDYVLPFHGVKASSSLASLYVVDGFGKQLVKLEHRGRYQVALRVTNNVNLTSHYWTTGVKIDLTAPIFRRVMSSYNVHGDALQVVWELFDYESGIKALYWSLNTSPNVETLKTFTKILPNATELLISDISLKLGQTYYVYFKAKNKAGLSTLFVSNGVVVDRTPPSAGRVSADFVLPENYDGNPNMTDGASFPARWSGFIDQESGIRSYQWAVGLVQEETMALGDDFFTDIEFMGSTNGYIIQDQTIHTDTIYYVCIRVTNGAGLSTTNCSAGVRVKLGKLTAGVVYDGPLGNDVDFQLDDKAMWLYWSGFEDPVYGLKQYSWCYGVIASAENDTFNCLSSSSFVDPPLKVSAHKFHDISLLHGKRYNAKVEAVNQRDEVVSAISDGFTVDRTAPNAGVLQIGGSHGTRTVYLTETSAPIVSWSMDEGESALQEFQFGIGTFPNRDDLFSFSKFNGSTYSLDLNEININLTHGLAFYVTVLGVNVLGLETRITSPQIVVDWLPPTPSIVRDGNGTDDIDFQLDVERLSATWNEFGDAESDIVEYLYCFGHRPDSCDVVNRTSVGLDLRAGALVQIQHGQTYFVTVTAINSAGLSTTSSSDGVTVDITPPVVQGFSIISATTFEQNTTNGNITVISANQCQISATWDYIIDEESDIKRVSVCATTVEDDCDIHAWMDVNPDSLVVTLDFERLLQAGTVFVLKLQVENGVGLKSNVNSDTIVIDNMYSASVKGFVKIEGKEGLVLLQEGQPLVATWQGFRDFETGIREYKWKVCSATKMSDCVTEFVSIGLKNSVALNDIGVNHGKEYKFVVKAINFAGLGSESVSNSFILDKTSPETGSVFNGQDLFKDTSYQSSPTEISASWKGFQDRESGISRYEVCIGSIPGLCDVSEFKNVGLATSTIVNNVNLTHNATYYTTVRATNGAGQSGFTSSREIRIDLTPPVGANLRDGEDLDIDLSVQDTFVSTNWDEFHDPESGILKYVVCAGTIMGACDLVSPTTVNNDLAARLSVKPAISSGTVVYSTLWVHNKAGQVTEIYSDGVLVDTTPPDIGNVEITSPSTRGGNTIYLTSRESLCASWHSFNDTETAVVSYHFSLCSKTNRNNCPIRQRNLNNKTSICIEEPPVTEGETYIVVITATNEVRLSSTSKSLNFVIDTTEPDVGEVVASNPLGGKYRFISSSVLARWKGFSDKESGVSEYFICIGSKPGLCNLTGSVSVGKASHCTWYNLSLVNTEEYFVSIKSVNHAGLFTDYIASDPFTVDITAPFPGQIFDGSVNGENIDYQQNRDQLSASWFEVEDLESDIVRLSWCIGSVPGSCDQIKNTVIDVTATKISAILKQPAKDGSKYYVTLTVVNSAGLSTTTTSDGVTIDYTSPSPGKVVVGQNVNTNYVRNGDTIYARWSGFEDTVSDIRSYQFALCETNNISVCVLEFTNVGLETNITLPGTDLENAKGYVVIVRATDFVGLTAEATSNEFIVDDTPPVSGWVSIVSSSPADSDVKQITSRWENFHDLESELSHYEICLGTSQGECDEVAYIPVGLNTTYTFNNLTLRHKEEYYVTVNASNVVGLSTGVTSNGIRIDLTPPGPVKHMTGGSSNSDGVCNALSDSCNGETSSESEIEISCKDDLVKVTWLNHEDKESGIALTEWCIETVNDTCNIQSWESLSPKTNTVSATIRSILGTAGARVVVRITNGVGIYVLLKSSQCNPERVFPPVINVSVVRRLNDTSASSVYQNNTDVIIVTWSLPDKSLHFRVQAALTKYDQNAATSIVEKWHGEPLVFNFVHILSGKSHVIFSGDRLKPYVRYRPVVRLCNKFDLCTDSSGELIIIIPDAPPDLKVNTTDTVQGTERDRWRKYVRGIPRLPREIFEDTLFLPDPLSVMIKANLRKENETTLFTKHVPITYQASVYRVTSGANETRNVTISSRQVFNDSHLYSELDVCCSKTNKFPQIISPDRQFIPVAETSLFGVTLSAFGKDLIIASSQNSVYVFSTESLHITPIAHVSFNTSINDSYVKVKAKNDTILVSGSGSLMLQKQNRGNLTSPSSFFYITNCNHTMTDEPEHCSGNESWSSLASMGREFAYDGAEIVAVSGRHPREGYSVVAVFKNDTIEWRLHQVLGHEERDSTVPYSIAVNHQFMVIAGSEVHVYSKMLDSVWEKETALSQTLPRALSSAKTVFLTSKNELFILIVKARTLSVFELRTSPVRATRRCRYVFSKRFVLSGGLDVSEGSETVAAIGMTSGGRDGAELILYERNGCTKIGGAFSETEWTFDDGYPVASVAVTENHLIVGTPGQVAWPNDYVNVGTGRLYVTTFCKRDHARKKVFGADQNERVVCIPCGRNEKAYPGFQERCTNCSNSICLNDSTDARFKVSHCETYPCTVKNNLTVRQNVSRDNLTVTESTQEFEDQDFYQPGSIQSYFIRLTQFSATGTTKTSDSFPFSIDYTSPEAGSVFDGLGSDDTRNCSANTTFSSEHQCSSRSFSETDLDYTNNTYEISARWIDFRDNESNIAHYFWCIGSEPLRDDIMMCENATAQQNRTLKGLSLQHNDKYYVTVIACNYAGLCTAKSSDGVLVDTTPPIMDYVRDGLVGPDIDFQVFTNLIFGNWLAEDLESGVASYEIGWGSEPGLDDVWEFQELGNASRWYAKFGEGGLEKGRKFYVTVKAINGAGLESEPLTSNGITVGKTEFVFSKNDSGSFFFDTVNVDTNETMEESEVGNTFGTVDVPPGAVDDDVKFQVYSLGEKEFKNGTDDNTTVVDPEVVKPPKHFKLGDYSFQIKAYEPENNTLQSSYRFKKPITITLVYDVDKMLKLNKKVVSDEVTNEDIDPVLLLWDEKNQTWFDAAQTCPEPWTEVDKKAKVLKVNVCHLTQFALFWTFEAENGIFEFDKGTNDTQSKPPPHAVIEEDNNVIYNPERYNGEMLLVVNRYKGSSGNIKVIWGVTIEPNAPTSFVVSPMSGELEFMEGQWNSSIHLRFPFIPDADQEIGIFVNLLNVSGGAMLGNFTSVKITFPANVGNDEETKPVENDNKSNKNDIILKILLPCLSGALLIVGVIAAIILACKGRESKKRVRSNSLYKINPVFGLSQNLRVGQPGTSFSDKDPPY